MIAIDGHAGAGKSTVARAVAEKLGFLHINTGAMYRAFTWKVLQEGMNPGDREAVEPLASRIKMELVRPSQSPHSVVVTIEGQDIGDLLRTPEINQAISQISAYPCVRQMINTILRAFQNAKGIVMDGRDIGTVVFPDATLKIFLTASVEERARRQYVEAQEKNQAISFNELKKIITQRDHKDSTREVAPLRLAEDAILLDTTDLNFEQVVDRILSIWQIALLEAQE